MRLTTLLATWLLVSALTPGAARAQWAVNGNPLCTAAGNQYNVAITSDSLGGAVVVWQDERNGSTNPDIYARQVAGSGAVQWPSNGVAICTAAGFQQYPQIAQDGFGHLYYVWEDNRGADTDIYVAATDRLGNVLTPANGTPLCNATGQQSGFSLTTSPILGTIYAAWTDQRAGNSDIYLQGFDTANFNFMGTNGKPICTLTSIQTNPAVCDNMPVHDGAIVAWQDFRNGNFDIYAQSTDLSGNIQWAANGIAVCTQAASQITPMIVSDGAGGAFIAWQDSRNGSGTVSLYAQRLNSAGVKQWATDGVPVAISTDLIELPKMISDGAGGVILAWEDDRNTATTGPDIYAQRLNGGGTPLWTANGVVVCNAAFSQNSSDVCTDGAQGCVVTWQDFRGLGPTDLYAQHLNASGVPQWTANGLVLCNSAGNQFTPRITNVGGAGVVAAWEDRRGANPDVYAQRLYIPTGEHGVPQPFITSIVDVPGDQGGFVRLTFRPGDDDFPGEEYEVFDNQYHGSDVVAVPTNNGSPSYTVDVLTTAVGSPDTYFIYADGQSNTVPGTSFDNLAPPAPTLSGGRTPGAIHLSWNVTAPDIDHYVLERLDVGTLASPTTNSFVDSLALSNQLSYRVHGVDIHGNSGPVSNVLVIPATTAVDLSGSAPRTLAVLPNSPNPFRTGTTMRFGLPREGAVRFAVYNVDGRRVALRDTPSVPAGWRELAFDGRDDRGKPLPSGIYFYRLDAGGENRSGKMVISR